MAFDPDDCTTYSQDVGDPVRLYAGSNPVDVYLLRDELIANGIPAVVIGENIIPGLAVGDNLSAARSGTRMIGDTLLAVWVGKHQLEEATAIAMSYDRDREERRAAALDLPPWTCNACGEEVEGGFEVCWNCQAERAGPEA